MPDFGSFLLIGAVAAAVTFITTPLVGMLARRRGWVYLPNDRTVHQTPLPDVGGLAMFIGFLAAMSTAWLVDAFDVLFENNSEPLGVLIAATIIFAVGFVDDIREVSAPAKVAGHGARRHRARAVRRRDVLVPAARSTTARSCSPTSHRSSPCCGWSA